MEQLNARPGGVAAEIGKRLPFDLPEVEAFVNLVRTHDRLSGEFERFFKSRGLTGPQYNVLRILRGHGARVRTRQVAAELVTREPDVTRLLDRLVARGWAARTDCAEDRRVVYVELTRAGATLLKSLDRPVRELHRAQLAHLGPRKLRQLNDLLFEARHPEDGASRLRRPE